MDPGEEELDHVNWINLAESRDRVDALSTVMNTENS